VYCFAKQSVIQIAAVKIIDRQKAPQDYQEKFLPRELKLWPKLRHPNLIALTDCFQVRNRATGFLLATFQEKDKMKQNVIT